MRIFSIGTLLLAMASAAPAIADVVYDSYGSVDYDAVAPPGEAVASVDVFYDRLAPYGVWVDDPMFGEVWIPDRAAFVPYVDGYWQATNVGFVWTSSEPFAWATTHYGRWAYSNAYVRWVWMPDVQWAPSWVEWSEYGDDIGWAPLAPSISVTYVQPEHAWHFCHASHLFDTDVVRYYEPRDRVVSIRRSARPVTRYATVGAARVVVGPDVKTLEQHRVTVRTTRVEPRAIGRMTAPDLHAAEARARERKPTVQAQNAKRIEANPTVRDVQKRVAPPRVQPAPRVQETPRVQPAPRVQETPRVQPAPRTQPVPRVEQPAPRTVPPTRVEKQPAPERPQAPPQTERPKAPPQTERPKAVPQPQTERPKAVPQPQSERPKEAVPPTRVETPRVDPTRPQRVEPARPQEPQRRVEPPPRRLEPTPRVQPTPPQRRVEPAPRAQPPATKAPQPPATKTAPRSDRSNDDAKRDDNKRRH